jgi:hypothetical protein
MKVVRSSPLRTGRLYPQEFSWYPFLEAESTPGHMVPSLFSVVAQINLLTSLTHSQSFLLSLLWWSNHGIAKGCSMHGWGKWGEGRSSWKIGVCGRVVLKLRKWMYYGMWHRVVLYGYQRSDGTWCIHIGRYLPWDVLKIGEAVFSETFETCQHITWRHIQEVSNINSGHCESLRSRISTSVLNRPSYVVYIGWINVVQEVVQWIAVVNAAVKLPVPHKWGNWLRV